MRPHRFILAIVLTCLTSHSLAQTQKPPPTIDASLQGFAKPVPGHWLSPSENRSGVPLGGLGTGFLEMRPDGLIHDAQFEMNRPPKTISGCSLEITIGKNRAQILGSAPEPKSSADTQHLLLDHQPSTINHQPCRYFGHYPMIDMDFGSIDEISVLLRAFSGFVPQDTELSNLPAGLFTVRLKNGGKQKQAVKLSFWWENDLRSVNPVEAGGKSADAGQTPRDEQTLFQEGRVVGIRMARKGIAGTYALAVRDDGWRIQAVPNDGASDAPARARIEAEAVLGPGESRNLTYVFAWHFPSWRDEVGKVWLNRYATRFSDARACALSALSRIDEIEQKIISWQSKFYSRNLPGWMKDGQVNSLYLLARNSIWLDDGRLLLTANGTGPPKIEPIAAHLDGSLPLLLLFPDQEKRVLREFARTRKPDGEIPGALGDSAGSMNPVFGPYRSTASTDFVLLVWRDWLWTRDKALLKDLYTTARQALKFAFTLDMDGNGLIEEPVQPDLNAAGWPWYGSATYTAGLGLAALRAGEELAKEVHDDEFMVWCNERLEKGKQSLQEDLWTGRYYRLYTDPDHFRQSDACYVDQLAGQTFAWLFDLGDLHPPAQTISALRAISELNVQATEWGAIRSTKPEGLADSSGGGASSGIAPQEVWSYASAALMAANLHDRPDLRQTGLLTAERAYSALSRDGGLWNQPALLDAHEGRPAGGPHDPGCVLFWALTFAYDGVSLNPAAPAK